MAGGFIPQIITPENIIDITIQYKTPSGGSSNSTPTIFVSYGSPAQYKRISLQEVLPYIYYLQIAAALIGKGVIAVQYTDFKTVILVGDPVPIDFEKPITFTLDAVNFGAGNTLTNLYNINVTSLFAATANFNVAAVRFRVPILTEGVLTFDEEYNLPVNTIHTAQVDGANWLVTVCIVTLDNTPLVFAVISNTFLKVENTTNEFNESLECSFWDYNFNRVNNVSYVGSGFSKLFRVLSSMNGGMELIGFVTSSITGLFDVTQVDASGVSIVYQSNGYSGYSFVLNPLTRKVLLKYKRARYSNTLGASKISIADNSTTSYASALIQDSSGTLQILRYPKGRAAGDNGSIVVYTTDAAILPYNLSFYNDGVLLNTVVVNTGLFVATPASKFWDVLVFGAGAVPPVTQNVYVVNETGAAISIITNIATYNFGIGVNGNIQCTPGGTVTNNSGATWKFTYLQSMPATLSPGEAPNPDTQIHTGVHNLDAVITDLNYIRVAAP